MGNKPKVSVLMPSLNVVEYIKECMDSVVNQTLKDIEIICIDANSTDGTLEILKEYEQKDRRVKVIISDKKSYGYQMNLGLNSATGEYVGIVETDDYIEHDMYSYLYKQAKNLNVDFIKSDYKYFRDENGKRNFFDVPVIQSGNHYNKIINNKEEPMTIFSADMFSQCGLYSLKMIRKNDIRYNPSPGASYQDNGFWFLLCCTVKKIYYTNKSFYRLRRDNPNSSIFSKEKVYCLCDEYDYIRNWLSLYPSIENKYSKLCAYFRNSNYWWTFNRIDNKYKKDFLLRFSKDFKEIIRKGEVDSRLFGEKEYSKLLKVVNEPMEVYEILSKNFITDNEQIERPIDIPITQNFTNVVFICEEENVKSLLVALVSLLVNSYNHKNIGITILCQNAYSQDSTDRISSINSNYNCDINFVVLDNIDKGNAEKIANTISSNLSEIDRCIYLDYNVVVQKDLTELFNIELNNFTIGGVFDVNVGIINLSVLLINCDKIRELKSFKVKEIDLKYNLKAIYFKNEPSFNFSEQVIIDQALIRRFNDKQLNEAFRENVIFSYSDSFNPLCQSNCSFIDIWNEYFEMSEKEISTEIIETEKNDNSILNEFDKSELQVIIWGDSLMAKDTLMKIKINELLNPKIKIVAICNNDKWLHGDFFKDVPIISLNELIELSKKTKNYVVIVSTPNNETITTINTLKYNGINLIFPLNYIDHYMDYKLNFVTKFNEIDEALIICSSHKTGNYTLNNTFSKHGIESAECWHEPKLKNYFNRYKKLKVIFAIREPIIQILSLVYQEITAPQPSYFNNYVKRNFKDKEHFLSDIKNIQSLFNNMILNGDKIWSNYFIKDIVSEFNSNILNIYNYPFDHQKGYTIIKEGNIEVFVYQLEKMNDIVKEMSDWIGQTPFDEWVRGNEASGKWIADSYKQAQKEITFSKEYFDNTYNQQWVQHFYSQEDIEKFKERWQPHIKE